MAGTEALTARILKEAEDKAEEIRSEAKSQAAKILEKAEKKAKTVHERTIEKAKEKAENSRNRKFTMAELDLRKEILKEKQLQIEKAFQGTLDNLAQLDTEEYQEIIWRMMMESVETGEETVVISEIDEERITPDFIEKVNKELEKEGKKGALKIASEKEDIGGGFILSSAHTKINSSFHSIVGMERDELEPKVAEILFQ